MSIFALRGQRSGHALPLCQSFSAGNAASTVGRINRRRNPPPLDNRARLSGDPADFDLACIHFNAVARKYDRQTPDASIHLLVEIILNALAAHQRYRALNPGFVLPAVDETGFRRWSKAHEAAKFFESPVFDRFVSAFGIEPSAARAQIHRFCAPV